MSDFHKSEHENILQERLIERVEQNLDLERWGFKLNYKSHAKGYVVIYDSSSCRLRCSLSLDPREKDDTIGIKYGRSHAPEEEHYMVYLGENCHAWHDFLMGFVGQFLDGMEPRVLARARIERVEIPSKSRKAFDESGIAKGLRNLDWGLRLDAFAWEYYGNDLFELFDIRNPGKWKAYCNFLTELYHELVKDPVWKDTFAKRPKWRPLPWHVC